MSMKQAKKSVGNVNFDSVRGSFLFSDQQLLKRSDYFYEKMLPLHNLLLFTSVHHEVNIIMMICIYILFLIAFPIFQHFMKKINFLKLVLNFNPILVKYICYWSKQRNTTACKRISGKYLNISI